MGAAIQRDVRALNSLNRHDRTVEQHISIGMLVYRAAELDSEQTHGKQILGGPEWALLTLSLHRRIYAYCTVDSLQRSWRGRSRFTKDRSKSS